MDGADHIIDVVAAVICERSEVDAIRPARPQEFICFGLGYMLQPSLAPGAGPNCFGHPGAGGSLAFADPDAELGLAYVMNAMQCNPAGDARSRGLVAGVYEAIV